MPAFHFVLRGDSDLANLPPPQKAFGLTIGYTSHVTNKGLKDLAGLQNLQTLNLFCCKGVTDEGLKELAGLKNLRSLNLTYTPVTDAGLKELARLKNLQSLKLEHAQVTDAGLKELARLKSLQSLGLGFRRREIFPRRRIAELRLEESRRVLEPLMGVIAELGRLPDPTEFDSTQIVEIAFAKP